MTEAQNIPSVEEIEEKLKERPRSPTLLSLKWLAEKIRRVEAIRRDLKSGQYSVDSERVAKSILNDDK